MPTTTPSDTTIRRLFAVSMNRCAYPDCETSIIDSTSNTILAEVCHIRARNQRGPRYDATKTDEERHGFDNLILLCGVHHKVVDAPENLRRFTPEVLINLKAKHEKEARTLSQPIVQLTDEQLVALQNAVTAYESGATHNDFRQAVFRVGGEGGHSGGGGGGGGVMTIAGTPRIPASIALNGQAGQAPGGGGGGGGVVKYVGRPVESDDLVLGLRLCSLLLANAASFSGSLLNVLGAGWTFVEIPSTPFVLHIWLALTFELGAIEPATQLRVSIQVLAPSGARTMECPIDIVVPVCNDLVKRSTHAQLLKFEVTEYGLWGITVSSSGHELGSHNFECRKA